MRKQVIVSATKIADHFRFFDTYASLRKKITKSQIAIIMYHRVEPQRDTWSFESLSQDCFLRQIEYFSRRAEIISLETLAKFLQAGKSPPETSIVITFDDGYYDNYVYAFPILKQHKIPATIFLTTGHISTDKLFWWDIVGYIVQKTSLKSINMAEFGSHSLDTAKHKIAAQNDIVEKLKLFPDDQKSLRVSKLSEILEVSVPDGLGKKLILSWDHVKEMYHEGISFGAHTVNHPLLTKIPIERAKWEILQSKRDIENILGTEIRAFSYPNGDYNDGLAEFARNVGFSCAVTTAPYHLIKTQDNIFALSRINMTENDNEYKLVYSGFQEDFKKLFRQHS